MVVEATAPVATSPVAVSAPANAISDLVVDGKKVDLSGESGRSPQHVVLKAYADGKEIESWDVTGRRELNVSIRASAGCSITLQSCNSTITGEFKQLTAAGSSIHIIGDCDKIEAEGSVVSVTGDVRGIFGRDNKVETLDPDHTLRRVSEAEAALGKGRLRRDRSPGRS